MSLVCQGTSSDNSRDEYGYLRVDSMFVITLDGDMRVSCNES